MHGAPWRGRPRRLHAIGTGADLFVTQQGLLRVGLKSACRQAPPCLRQSRNPYLPQANTPVAAAVSHPRRASHAPQTASRMDSCRMGSCCPASLPQERHYSAVELQHTRRRARTGPCCTASGRRTAACWRPRPASTPGTPPSTGSSPGSDSWSPTPCASSWPCPRQTTRACSPSCPCSSQVPPQASAHTTGSGLGGGVVSPLGRHWVSRSMARPRL